MGIQASYYAFAALRNRVKWCTIMFSSVSGMPDFSPKSVTLNKLRYFILFIFFFVFSFFLLLKRGTMKKKENSSVNAQ